MTSALLLAELSWPVFWTVVGVVFLIGVIATLIMFKKCYIVVGPDKAIVKSGIGGLDVSTAEGTFVVPLFHRYEFMDLTLKSFEISRQGSEGLICKDNIRADIKVAFFIRVDSSKEEMKEVAQSIGARRCSELETLARTIRRQIQRSVEDGRESNSILSTCTTNATSSRTRF